MTSTTAEITIERDASDRQRKLASAVTSLRTKAGGADGSKALLLIGGVLIPLGFVLIILGWEGASHTVNLYEQIPYSISGGMLGLALVFAGGFTYFAYWLTQLVYDARTDAADTKVVLERIEEILASTAALTVGTTERGNGTTRRRPVAAATFLATPTGTMFHRPDCPAVSGRDGLREVTGDETDLTPCRICDPVSV